MRGGRMVPCLSAYPPLLCGSNAVVSSHTKLSWSPLHAQLSSSTLILHYCLSHISRPPPLQWRPAVAARPGAPPGGQCLHVSRHPSLSSVFAPSLLCTPMLAHSLLSSAALASLPPARLAPLPRLARCAGSIAAAFMSSGLCSCEFEVQGLVQGVWFRLCECFVPPLSVSGGDPVARDARPQGGPTLDSGGRAGGRHGGGCVHTGARASASSRVACPPMHPLG